MPIKPPNAINKLKQSITKAFARLGAPVVSIDVGEKTRRTAGIAYQEVFLTFADSQQVTLRLKESGDVFQVLLNGTAVPLRSQDDLKQAVMEVYTRLERGRAAFQKKLAKAAVAVPPSLTTAAPQLEQQLTAKRDSLREAFAAVQAEIAQLSVTSHTLKWEQQT